jgi:hypothetical protein
MLQQAIEEREPPVRGARFEACEPDPDRYIAVYSLTRVGFERVKRDARRRSATSPRATRQLHYPIVADRRLDDLAKRRPRDPRLASPVYFYRDDSHGQTRRRPDLIFEPRSTD